VATRLGGFDFLWGDPLFVWSLAMKYVKRVLILYAMGPPLVVVGSIAFCLIKAAITGDRWLAVGAVAMALIIMAMVGAIWFLVHWLFGRRAKWGGFWVLRTYSFMPNVKK